MEFEWDEEKSAWTLQRRGFDFAIAARIFESAVQTTIDDRRDYGEERLVALGEVDGWVLVVVYTDRNGVRRIISARRANRKEQEIWRSFVER